MHVSYVDSEWISCFIRRCWANLKENLARSSVLSSKAGNVQDLAYGEVKGAFICTLYIVFQIFVHSPSKDVQLFVIIGTYRCQSVMEQKKNKESSRTHVVQHLHDPQRSLV